MLAIIVGICFLSVALLTCVLLYPVFSRRELIRSRVAGLIPEAGELPQLVVTPHPWQQALARLGIKLRMREKDLQTFQEMTTASGFRRDSVYIVLGIKLLLCVVLPGMYLVFLVLPAGSPGRNNVLISVILAISGYLIPTFWLGQRAKARKTEIFHSLPDVLDLLTVCVEAGLGLDAALVKTVDSYQDPGNPLIQELDRATREIRAGRARYEALKAVAERTGVEDLKAFITMLVQSERFGTSLGKTLRTYSDSLRVRRKQLAEEKAGKTAVKMLFPLTFCIFPALLVVMLVPAFYRIYALFKR